MARRQRTRAGRRRNPLTLPLIAIALAFMALFALMHYTAADRSWEEYIEAGDRALERGNYEWAEKMYLEALQYAESKGLRDPLVAKTQRYLERVRGLMNRAQPR